MRRKDERHAGRACALGSGPPHSRPKWVILQVRRVCRHAACGRLAGILWALIRSRSRARSAAVYFQLNGLAVRL